MLNNLFVKQRRINILSAIILTIMFFTVPFQLLFINKISADAHIIQIAGYYLYILLTGFTAFFMFYLKKASKIRVILFSALAFIFIFPFMSNLYLERGHIGITLDDIPDGLPFCHIAVVNELLTIPIKKIFVFPGRFSEGYASIYGMILIWIWASILLGKGWCSWGCFYGGWDNFFSNILKKPLINISDKTARKLRLIPVTLLIFLPVISFVLLEPFFCSFLCPFKTITEFQQVTSFSSWIIFVVTVVLFFSVCILFPLLFGKRIWCTYGCPFGVLQGGIGKVISPFKLKINSDCIDCKKCVRVCKTEGITLELLKKKKFGYNCSLCLSCVEECPKNAIKVTTFGVDKIPFNKVENDNSTKKRNMINYIKDTFQDVFSPHSFMIFFALTVFHTFFSLFYFDTFKFIAIFLGGN